MSLRDNYIFDLDKNVTRTPVSYKNRFGITIAADLYRPNEFDKSREYAAVIVGAPYGGVKEQGPGIYAQNMALRGFVALTFDPSFNEERFEVAVAGQGRDLTFCLGPTRWHDKDVRHPTPAVASPGDAKA